ncbi:hypothetical protein NHX12_010211 [Muraenolepis orangiensis]|uniref:Uncharacterized protein n=1 Tax=Muraenolepis orangiensis TaxID=630683 RepID=A0A9Q0DKQ8_9TELE|nr:hypothetical protein NHX12_010211 [Muraenolepis orangiensis]
MVLAEFWRRFDVLAPHLTKKHGHNFIVTDEKRVSPKRFTMSANMNTQDNGLTAALGNTSRPPKRLSDARYKPVDRGGPCSSAARLTR